VEVRVSGGEGERPWTGGKKRGGGAGEMVTGGEVGCCAGRISRGRGVWEISVVSTRLAGACFIIDGGRSS